MTLALDASNDLYLGGRSGIATATGADGVVQGVRTRLRLFRGEWFLDVTRGTPWFEEVFVSGGQDVRRVERAIKSRILETPGVEEITSFAIAYGAGDRSISITFEVDTIFGPSGLVEVSP